MPVLKSAFSAPQTAAAHGQSSARLHLVQSSLLSSTLSPPPPSMPVPVVVFSAQQTAAAHGAHQTPTFPNILPPIVLPSTPRPPPPCMPVPLMVMLAPAAVSSAPRTAGTRGHRWVSVSSNRRSTPLPSTP